MPSSKPDWIHLKVTGHEDAAQNFLRWLCEMGEQQYWDWMDCRKDQVASGYESAEGAITVNRFRYDYDDLTVDAKLEDAP